MKVLYSLTENYYKHLHFSLDSLRKHNDVEKVYVFAQNDDIGRNDCEVINLSGQQFIRHDSPSYRSQYSIMSVLRVVAPLLIREDKVLYLDADTIVTDSLLPVWETDMTGKWVGWVSEERAHYRPYGDKYFNAGVLLMNLEQMRKDKVAEQLLDLLNTEKLKYYEQDALNKLTDQSHYVELPLRYNEAFCTGLTKNPAIVHYAGFTDWYENKTTMLRWEYKLGGNE